MHCLIIVLLNSYEQGTGSVQEEVAWEGDLTRLPLNGDRLVVEEIAAARAGTKGAVDPEPLPFDVRVIDLTRQPAFNRTRIYMGAALSSHAERTEARRILIHHFGFRHEWALYGVEDPVCDDFEARHAQVLVDVCNSTFSPMAGKLCARLQRTMELGGGHAPGWRIELTRPPRDEPSLADDDFVTEMAAYSVMIEGVVPAWEGSDEIVMASAHSDLGVDPWRIVSMLVREYGFTVGASDIHVPDLEPVAGVRPPRPGDIVEMPLPDGRFGYARYDCYSENEGSLVTVLAISEARPADSLAVAAAAPVFGPVHTGVIHAVLTGRWRVVGHVTVDDAPPASPFRYWSTPRYGRSGGWELYADGEFTELGPRLPREHRNLEMLWLWPCEDLEYRIMTGTSPHLERMRQFE